MEKADRKKGQRQWIIGLKGTIRLFWSNSEGWTGEANASTFSMAEKKGFLLPCLGEWRKVILAR